MTAMAECTIPGQMLDQSSSIHKSKEQLKEPAEIHSGLACSGVLHLKLGQLHLLDT